ANQLLSERVNHLGRFSRFAAGKQQSLEILCGLDQSRAGTSGGRADIHSQLVVNARMEARSSIKVAVQFRRCTARIGQDAQLAVRVQVAVPGNLGRINAFVDQSLYCAIEISVGAGSVPDLGGNRVEVSGVPESLHVADHVRGAANGNEASALASLGDQFIDRSGKREWIEVRALRATVVSHCLLLGGAEPKTYGVA